MQDHEITVYGKKIRITDKSVFRVEERRLPKGSYEGIYSHKNVHSAVSYFCNTTLKKDRLLRLVKDGDEFVVITKATFPKEQTP